MISVYLKQVSLLAPGLPNWAVAKKIFNAQRPYVRMSVEKKLTTLLPANENRRASRLIKLSLNVIQQLFSQIEDKNIDKITPKILQYVFSSCNGDLTIFDQISTALTIAGRPVSPTKFHHSVHNAPAGYCAIALEAKTASTSISGGDDSFANGLLEAAVQLTSSKDSNAHCLLTAYDEIPPEPFLSIIPISDEFACSLLLSKKGVQAFCRLDINLVNNQRKDFEGDLGIKELSSELQLLYHSNPQAKSLPLLSSLAKKENKTLYFDCNQNLLSIKLTFF